GSGGPRGAGPRSAVVRGLPADPAVSLAGVPGSGVDFVRGVVPGPAGGGASGADRRCRAAQPDQPARGQGEDVELQEETPRASPRTTLEEDLCRISSYALLNGIGTRPDASQPRLATRHHPAGRASTAEREGAALSEATRLDAGRAVVPRVVDRRPYSWFSGQQFGQGSSSPVNGHV